MHPADRAVFVAAYSRLVVEVWSDPDRERRLVEQPRALLGEYGLELPEHVSITVHRERGNAEPDLDAQVSEWSTAIERGELALYVPVLEVDGELEIDEHELDSVVAGLDASSACCCPCCCT
jgi:hypothetical protein